MLGRSLNPGNTAAPSLPGEMGRHMLLGSDHHGVVGAAANETATVGAVPVAIDIPVFTTQLERSREATDLASIRAAYAEAMTDLLLMARPL